MEKEDAEIISFSQHSIEDCEKEIADYETNCDLFCSQSSVDCGKCLASVIIGILKRRKKELLNKEVS